MTEACHPIPEPLRRYRFPQAVREVLATLRSAGHPSYLVGGCVRDILLGKQARDFDVATRARAEQVQALFRRVLLTGVKHGTVTVRLRGLSVEVTTFRGEGPYVDGRRPERVYFLDDVVQDLARRDFTINAIAYDPLAPELVDPFGGQADLAARTIRCVGDPHQRFAEDGLRPLRAVRFASVLGFDIDEATARAIPGTLDTFSKVAAERVREELLKLLLGPRPALGLRLLRQTGLLGRALPEVDALAAPAFELTCRRVERIAPREELRLAALLHDLSAESVASALERLRLPNRVSEAVRLLVRERDFARAEPASDVELRRLLARVGPPQVESLLALGRAQAEALSSRPLLANAQRLEDRVRRVLGDNPPLTVGQLALNGNQVMRLLGQSAGPGIGATLRYLLDRVLEDPARNTPEALTQLIRLRFPPRDDPA